MPRAPGSIAGPHRAGLTLGAFAPPGTTLIEFLEPSYCFDCFFWLAGAAGHHHGSLMGRTEGVPTRHGANIRLDIGHAVELLETAIAEEPRT
jgi:hypothetical protein